MRWTWLEQLPAATFYVFWSALLSTTKLHAIIYCCVQTMITRATATHMSSYFDKPRPQQRSGRENQSGHMASLVICYNSGLTWSVWSYRPLSTAARATGSQSSSLCKCVSMCVLGGSPGGKGSLVSQFSALIGVNEWSFCCSAESLHLLFT